MSVRSSFLFSLLLVMGLLLCACKPGVPGGVLSAGKMEDMLYDYHLAQSLAQQAPPDSVDFYTRLYEEAVFAKYDLTRASFDSSMVWYSRHTDALEKVYARLAERLGDDSGAGAGGEPSPQGKGSGDTLNVWRGASAALLCSQGRNRYAFSLRADTAFHAGDRLLWSFDTQWYYHEGTHQAYAVLYVRYEGDSVAVATQSVFSSGRQTLSMTLAGRKVIQVEGFVYQDAPWAERPRLLGVSRFALCRIRGTSISSVPSAANGGGASASHPSPQVRLRDSLLRADTLNERRPHFR